MVLCHEREELRRSLIKDKYSNAGWKVLSWIGRSHNVGVEICKDWKNFSYNIKLVVEMMPPQLNFGTIPNAKIELLRKLSLMCTTLHMLQILMWQTIKNILSFHSRECQLYQSSP